MTLDHWLVARLAMDIGALINGGRIQALSASDAGIILYCYRRGSRLAMHINVDPTSPLAAGYELGEGVKESGTLGWASAVATLLRGASIDAVRAVPKDRILVIDVSSRSAFGVPSRSRIIAELQPRKANALVLRRGSSDEWIVVAAAKQFTGVDEARSVQTGQRYVPPPPQRASLDRAQFIIAAGEAVNDAGRLARLLTQFDPACTPALAREAVYRVAAQDRGPSARALLDSWKALRHEVETALSSSRDVFIIKRNGPVVACHLIPLRSVIETENGSPAIVETSSLNDVCAAQIRSAPAQRGRLSLPTLRKKLTKLLARCDDEVVTLETAYRRAEDAAALRVAGDTIYAHVTEIAAGADRFIADDGRQVALDPLLTAKQNAAEYFRKYKKARSGLPRIASRLRALRANRDYWEQLAWELDRLDQRGSDASSVLAEVAAALGTEQQVKGRRTKPQELSVSIADGAMALIGRSPKDNERLTFTVASPNDYWFHARGIPGSHVIVKSPARTLSLEQIEEAASLAAGHSRASNDASVDVDYTQRKHVRRHSSGRPGLVSYTDFKTVRVRPRHG